METAALIIGYVATIVTLGSLQLKRLDRILLFAILANILAAASNFLIGGYSGSGVCAVAVIQTIVSLLAEKKMKNVPIWVTGLFAACYVIITVITFNAILDVLPCVSALLYACAVIQKKTFYYRVFMALNATSWISYELTLATPNYAMALTFALQLLSTVVGIIRNDLNAESK